jgi:hypothetical protein
MEKKIRSSILILDKNFKKLIYTAYDSAIATSPEMWWRRPQNAFLHSELVPEDSIFPEFA